ncbi:hypothetical protein BJ508DRAFT_312595 [Ascobolus immersus RN42]|uniref:Uncharacterized protein n=1 Tax=Ascobolus immersus RN42 TaxID=1160509 RepID=A0A3N4HLV4_ASCIM|nr:hypothetical protein BJ508DRAFT_312595 [Ascobolus immersus RN42]
MATDGATLSCLLLSRASRMDTAELLFPRVESASVKDGTFASASFDMPVPTLGAKLVEEVHHSRPEPAPYVPEAFEDDVCPGDFEAGCEPDPEELEYDSDVFCDFEAGWEPQDVEENTNKWEAEEGDFEAGWEPDEFLE